jgi:hypothetical protein
MTDSTKFLYDLQRLLEKHKATISADDHWIGYAECGQDIRVEIDIEDNYETLDFKYIDAKSLNELIDQRIIDNA